jgi:hypothetical protein
MTETIMYRLESTPDLMVGVTPNATIVLQLTEVKQRIAIPNPAELQQVIEQAMVTQRAVARVLYPSELRSEITDVLAGGPRSLRDLQDALPAAGVAVRDELRAMCRDGMLTIQPPSGPDGVARYKLAVTRT